MSDPYLDLQAEIAKPAYAGLDDAAVVAALNAAGPPAPAPYPASWLCQLLSTLKVAHVIEDEAKDLASPVRDICLALQWFAWGVGANREVDVTDPNFLADLDALVAAGKLTAEQRAAIVGAGARPTAPVAAGLGFPRGVTARDLEIARSR